jgi:hypothetical protein
VTEIIKVEILPTAIWIENDMFGGRAVMMQHQGMDEFEYAKFGYQYPYSSNSGTWDAAVKMAISLGAKEPVEVRHRGVDWKIHTADELRSEIVLMKEELVRMGEPVEDKTKEQS